MQTLHDVYCLGCKTRHPEVEVEEILETTVRGSLRLQARGLCEEGRKWAKILKRSEWPEDYQVSSETPQLEAAVSEPLQDAPYEGEVEGGALAVFERAAQTATESPEPVPVPEPEPVLAPEPEPVPTASAPVGQVQVEVVEREPPTVEVESVVVKTPEISERPPFSGPESVVPIQIPESQIQIPSGLSSTLYEPDNAKNEKNEKVIALKSRSDFTQVNRPRPDRDPRARARRIGSIVGERMFEMHGGDFTDYFEDAWQRTRVPEAYFEDFAEAYFEVGVQLWDEERSGDSDVASESSVLPPEEQLSTRSVLGIASLSVFGAWLASRVTRR